jgi:hypothetical protein
LVCEARDPPGAGQQVWGFTMVFRIVNRCRMQAVKVPGYRAATWISPHTARPLTPAIASYNEVSVGHIA